MTILFTLVYYHLLIKSKAGATTSTGGDRLFFFINLVVMGKTIQQLDAELAAAEARIKARRDAIALKAGKGPLLLSRQDGA